MKHIIIGGVAGGATAAARIRRADETAEIVLLEKGRYISYANCGLPYYIGGTIAEREKLFVQTPTSFGTRFRIDVRVESEAVAVDPAARGCGAGQALVDAAITLARRLGLDEVTLEVRTDNDSAIRLYARNGFRDERLLRGYYPDGTDARRMSFRTSCGRPE